MINNFSNEATAVVFEIITSDPDRYERALEVTREQPAKAPQEFRSWVEREVEGANPTQSALIETAMRAVRWTELRQKLQTEALRN